MNFSEPVAFNEAEARVRILVNGTPVAAGLTATPTGGAVIGLSLQPNAPLPFDSDVSIDLGGLTGADGQPAELSHPAAGEPGYDHRQPRPTPADPGPLTGNGGFETGLDHWMPGAQVVQAAGTFGTVAPSAGAQQAVIQRGVLSGYIDVPPGATTLSFSAAVLTRFVHSPLEWPELELPADPSVPPEFERGTSATVSVYLAGQSVPVFDVYDYRGQVASCECDQFTNRIGPLLVQVDVTPYRGQRIFIIARGGALWVFGIGSHKYALLLDSFEIH